MLLVLLLSVGDACQVVLSESLVKTFAKFFTGSRELTYTVAFVILLTRGVS